VVSEPVALINSTLREYRHSKIGLQTHTPLLAWACRNLRELDVLTKYVLRSEADARREFHLNQGI
jgi:hypothetical protein